MQVTNSATIVDYFPEAFIAESDDIKGMKLLRSNVSSSEFISALLVRNHTVWLLHLMPNMIGNRRINNGATVTGFNTDKMPRSEYMPLMC